jgi:hypothetical protein
MPFMHCKTEEEETIQNANPNSKSRSKKARKKKEIRNWALLTG